MKKTTRLIALMFALTIAQAAEADTIKPKLTTKSTNDNLSNFVTSGEILIHENEVCSLEKTSFETSTNVQKTLTIPCEGNPMKTIIKVTRKVIYGYSKEYVPPTMISLEGDVTLIDANGSIVGTSGKMYFFTGRL